MTKRGTAQDLLGAVGGLLSLEAVSALCSGVSAGIVGFGSYGGEGLDFGRGV